MRYGSLSELVVLPEKEGDGKFNAEEYVNVIMDRELFNRWKKGMEELGDLVIMEDGQVIIKVLQAEKESNINGQAGILEVPQLELPRVRHELPGLMASVATLKTPLVVDVGYGPNWERAH